MPPRSNDPLADLEPFAEQLYSGLDLDRLTAYGVRLLSDRGLPVTFENVVVTLFRLFPAKFSIVGYPEYPDAARINRAILHCFPKYRNYLSGRARTGYRLTHQGEVAAEEAATALAGAGKPVNRRRTAARGVADNFMKEVSDSKVFADFVAGSFEAIDLYDITRLLHASPNSPREVLRRNMDQLLTYSKETGRDDVLKFLTWATETFPELAEAG